ncbi:MULTISPECIES: DUF3742 family protein [Alcaligenaceae]|uniref:Uncharacterized protein DUF3742 n=1 Tax=Eoetvoesiella caeni TaxID=645616 RepID=A0A366H5C5_9BURK|nr:DUF3742 family protein [Eoetvoesiella caeni]MCI2810331.1 DUF3742 family protein [Eoetvoesiella caeni]NYT54700.1 DUF3742 family protein [Eoetvoesiella caeni]RBP37131.1 uncharacterized protein DUF3742 [Eoetvoesiella caeni]
MDTTTRISTAERFGRLLGLGWRAYARGELQVSKRLASQGVPITGAVALLWLVKLTALGLLLYAAFWLAMLVVFLVAGAWVARNAEWDEPETEWRTGPAGFGLYRGDIRIDVGDPYEED